MNINMGTHPHGIPDDSGTGVISILNANSSININNSGGNGDGGGGGGPGGGGVGGGNGNNHISATATIPETHSAMAAVLTGQSPYHGLSQVSMPYSPFNIYQKVGLGPPVAKDLGGMYDPPNSLYSSLRTSNLLSSDPSVSPPPPPRMYKPCVVCSDKSSGYHYGVSSCEGCKGFFRRSVQKNMQYTCHKDKTCIINKVTRNRCQYCRLQKCVAMGMSKEAVRNDRNKKRKQKPESTSCLSEELTEDDQMLIQEVVDAHRDTTPTGQNGAGPSAPPAHSTTPNPVMGPAAALPSPTTTPSSATSSSNSSSGEDANATGTSGVFLWEKITELSSAGIVLIVDFAKKIPGFVTLTTSDQITLLKAACLEIMILRISIRYDIDSDTMQFSNGLSLSREQLQKGGFGPLTTTIFSFACSLKSMGCDETEYAMLSSICLISGDRSGLQDIDKIEQLQEPLLEALKHYIRFRRPDQRHVFAKMLMKLTDLRSISVKGEKQVSPYTLDCLRDMLTQPASPPRPSPGNASTTTLRSPGTAPSSSYYQTSSTTSTTSSTAPRRHSDPREALADASSNFLRAEQPSPLLEGGGRGGRGGGNGPGPNSLIAYPNVSSTISSTSSSFPSSHYTMNANGGCEDVSLGASGRGRIDNGSSSGAGGGGLGLNSSKALGGGSILLGADLESVNPGDFLVSDSPNNAQAPPLIRSQSTESGLGPGLVGGMGVDGGYPGTGLYPRRVGGDKQSIFLNRWEMKHEPHEPSPHHHPHHNQPMSRQLLHQQLQQHQQPQHQIPGHTATNTAHIKDDSSLGALEVIVKNVKQQPFPGQTDVSSGSSMTRSPKSSTPGSDPLSSPNFLLGGGGLRRPPFPSPSPESLVQGSNTLTGLIYPTNAVMNIHAPTSSSSTSSLSSSSSAPSSSGPISASSRLMYPPNVSLSQHEHFLYPRSISDQFFTPPILISRGGVGSGSDGVGDFGHPDGSGGVGGSNGGGGGVGIVGGRHMGQDGGFQMEPLPTGIRGQGLGQGSAVLMRSRSEDGSHADVFHPHPTRHNMTGMGDDGRMAMGGVGDAGRMHLGMAGLRSASSGDMAIKDECNRDNHGGMGGSGMGIWLMSSSSDGSGKEGGSGGMRYIPDVTSTSASSRSAFQDHGHGMTGSGFMEDEGGVLREVKADNASPSEVDSKSTAPSISQLIGGAMKMEPDEWMGYADNS